MRSIQRWRMARGKKTGGRDWKPGQSGNPNGRRPYLPHSIKDARKLNKIEAERLLNKFLDWPLEQLVAFVSDKKNPVLEVLIARNLIEANKKGDQNRTEGILQRIIEKVRMKWTVTTLTISMRNLGNFINQVEGGKHAQRENQPKTKRTTEKNFN